MISPPPPSSPHPNSALNLWECRHLQLPQEGGQGLLSCSWHGKLKLPEIAWDCAAAKLRQPWICHLEWGKASSAALLCLLGGCGAHPIWDPPSTSGKTGLKGQSDTGRQGSKSLLDVAGDPAGRQKEKGLSTKLPG